LTANLSILLGSSKLDETFPINILETMGFTGFWTRIETMTDLLGGASKDQMGRGKKAKCQFGTFSPINVYVVEELPRADLRSSKHSNAIAFVVVFVNVVDFGGPTRISWTLRVPNRRPEDKLEAQIGVDGGNHTLVSVVGLFGRTLGGSRGRHCKSAIRTPFTAMGIVGGTAKDTRNLKTDQAP